MSSKRTPLNLKQIFELERGMLEFYNLKLNYLQESDISIKLKYIQLLERKAIDIIKSYKLQKFDSSSFCLDNINPLLFENSVQHLIEFSHYSKNQIITLQEKSYIRACFEGDLKSVKTTVEYSVDVTVANCWGINIASEKGFKHIIKFLLEESKLSDEVWCLSSMHLYGAIYNAVKQNDYEFAEYLFDRSPFYKRTTGIQQFASNGNIKALSFLLPRIVEGGFRDSDLIHLYTKARDKNRISTVEFLDDNEVYLYDSIENKLRNI